MTIDESLIYNEQTYGHKIQLKTYNEIKENLQDLLIFIYLHILKWFPILIYIGHYLFIESPFKRLLHILQGLFPPSQEGQQCHRPDVERQ